MAAPLGVLEAHCVGLLCLHKVSFYKGLANYGMFVVVFFHILLELNAAKIAL